MHVVKKAGDLTTLFLLTVRPYGEQGSDFELEADSSWNFREARAHEETPSVRSLQRCAE